MAARPCISAGWKRPRRAASRRRARRARHGPAVKAFRWSRDGKRLLLLMDSNGDENANLFAVDVEAAEPVARNLTPLDGVRVELVGTSNEDPNVVDRPSHRPHRPHVRSLPAESGAPGELTIFAENPGNVCSWSTSPSGRVRMRVRCLPDAAWTAEVPDGVGGWREVMRGSYGDHVRILGYPLNPRYAWALSNRSRSRVALVRIDLRNGNEDVLYEHPTVDLFGARVVDSGVVSHVWAWPGFQELALL